MPLFITPKRRNRNPAIKTAINIASKQAIGLVGLWSLDGHSKDCSLFDNDGTWSGSSTSRYAPGPPMLGGRAGSFNGDDYLDFTQLGSFSSIVSGGAFTVSGWSRTSTTGRQTICGDWSSSATSNSFWFGFGGYLVADGDFGAGFAGAAVLDTNFAYSQGRWYDAWGDAGTNMTVGRGGDYDGLYLTGDVADFHIYNRASAASEIRDIYLNGRKLYQRDLPGNPINIGEAPPAISPTPWHLFNI
jgi:hypothetical protein